MPKKPSNAENNPAETLRQKALDYHASPTAGKWCIHPTKSMANANDLSLAYSPGVAVPCEEIAKDITKSWDYTNRRNLVAVISNGTAVLGLGNIGAAASKPVMEGKSVLFKKFADIDSIDLEIDSENVDDIVETIARLEYSFGGINLEDFKAPECFEIENRLRERMNIPVFHDDQHGTAIIVGAAVTNWVHLTKRDWSTVKVVSSGAGASAIACLTLLTDLGVKRENIVITDRKGVVTKKRGETVEPQRAGFANDASGAKDLKSALKNFKPDIFLGLSAAGVLKQDWIKDLPENPLILALANPTPEIMPELVAEVRPDAYMCTGRSDYPNQVNNVLCFPYIFRGALDVGATKITDDIKVACVNALAKLARKQADDSVTQAYGGKALQFGKDYMIPKPFDPRLIVDIPVAVAKASIDLGLATRPIDDWEAYRAQLEAKVNKTTMVMRPLQSIARRDRKKVIFAEAEERHILQAAQQVWDDGVAHPVLVGRREVVETRIKRLGLTLTEGEQFDLVDPEDDPRYHEYWSSYHEKLMRRGVTPSTAKTVIRTNTTVIASMLLHKGAGDAMICGAVGPYNFHLKHVSDIIGLREGVSKPAAMSALLLDHGTLFILDPYVNIDPTPEELTDITLLAVEEINRFGIDPAVALLSHSNFGTHGHSPSSQKMQATLAQLKRRAPDLNVDGEMHADAAINPELREKFFPYTDLVGSANLLVMPNMDAANITFNLIKALHDAVTISPILLGMSKPVHIVHPSVRTRGIVNLATAAVARLNATDNHHDFFAQVV